MSKHHPHAYYRATVKVVLGLLFVWFSVSFGCGILLREWLDEHMFKVGNAPFGFWMSQQGSIICFVLLLVTYMLIMNHLDEKYGYDEED